VIRPARITWTAALLLFGGAIALALGTLAFFIPGEDRTISIMALVVGAWGIVTGTGLLRLWRWARISALITGGLAAYVGSMLTAMILFFHLPVPSDLREQLTMEAATEIVTKIKMILMIVLPLFAAAGFWWVYLFSDRTIKELFGSSASTRPRAFTVVGGYFVMSALFGAWFLWQGVRQRGPLITMDFGSILVGSSALVARISYIVVQLFLGAGLLRRTGPGRKLAIYYLLFECLNITVFLLRPGREARIALYHDMIAASSPTLGTDLSSASLSGFMRVASIGWALFALIAIWFLARRSNPLDATNS
jgi:hypothetical protein